MRYDKLHSKQAVQAFASPWSPEALWNAKGPFSCPCRQAGVCTDGQTLRAEQRELPSAHLLPPDSHPARLFALYKERLSFWFCVLFKI